MTILHTQWLQWYSTVGIPIPTIEAMLSTIENMKFYLRTGFGNSQDYAGGETSNRMDQVKPQAQVMCQGNGASPAAWAVTTIPMIRAHRKKGHGAHFVAPISNKECQLIRGLFVDDTDLTHVNMRTNECIIMAHSRLHKAIYNWGQLLIATGGMLKPAKCTYYLISFRWKPDGSWVYDGSYFQLHQEKVYNFVFGNLLEMAIRYGNGDIILLTTHCKI